ncbi:E3 ubiquitin-protein ligase WAV3-like [Triticum urartu]|uniref:VWFA domain-containing protein n=1 Tax=Triticum urartu TaxID=4572 RepID=A0A8R7UDD9_TRIUA|nr:E3 ubiquitin-protein ligase WAV3-like [Triticum urartu]
MALFHDDDKPSSPNNAGSSKDGLVTMAFPAFSRKDVGLTKDAVTAVVEIKATSSAAMREGLDLVAVLDVSGSMSGDKIESVKKALQFVIMKLTPMDRLSIVTFDSSARRLNPLRSMTQAAQTDLKAIVNGLAAGGGTDIKAGLDLGLAVLGGRVHTESRTPNIFLMSDGQTSGDPRQVNPGDVAVYTFGFGAGTDHKLLSDLAKKSTGGTYSAVPDGTNLSAPFSQLLGGLLTVVAQDVQLTLEPNNADGDLDKMTVAPGTDYTTTTDAKSGLITIKFGTLFSGEARKVAVNFTLRDSDETEEYDATLAEARHSYAGQKTRQPSENILIVRTPNPSPADPSSAGASQRSVQAEELRRLHANTIGTASLLADAEKLAEAREKIMDAQNAVEDIMLDDGERMINALRAELLQLLTFMESQALYNERGHPYALATIASHGRQRTAGRGDEGEVISLYVTPRMIAYLEQAKRFEENPEEPVPTADDDVEEEIKNDPFGTIAAPLALYLDTAIQALQSIKKVLADASQRKR